VAYFIYPDPEQAHLLSLTLMAPGHITRLAPFRHLQYKQVPTIVEHRARKKHRKTATDDN